VVTIEDDDEDYSWLLELRSHKIYFIRIAWEDVQVEEETPKKTPFRSFFQ
jgi:hypothetical protein